jgi:hypothetical protein
LLQISWFLRIRRQSGFVTALEKVMKKKTAAASRCKSFQYGGEAAVYGIRCSKKYDDGDVVNMVVKEFLLTMHT